MVVAKYMRFDAEALAQQENVKSTWTTKGMVLVEGRFRITPKFWKAQCRRMSFLLVFKHW